MKELIGKLNEILAAEWACARTLRRAERRCQDPGVGAVIQRVRKDCSRNCTQLATAVRTLGGGPTDVPSTRFSLQLADETLMEAVDMAQSAQQHIADEIAALLAEPALAVCRPLLAQIQKAHQEDSRWLKAAGAREA